MFLFRVVNLRHMISEPGKFIMSVLGVALGVAVFTAIRIANFTAFAAFESSIDVVSGKANLQILSESGAGIDEKVFQRLKELKAVKAITPVIEQYGQLNDSNEKAIRGSGHPLLILGVDPFSDAAFRAYRSTTVKGIGADYLQFLTRQNAMFITRNYAERAGVRKGDSLPLVIAGRYYKFYVIDVLVPEGTQSKAGVGIGIVDIATAQELFSRQGRLDRIDMIVPQDRIEEAADYIQTLLPSDLAVRTPAARTAQVQTMVEAYELNLTALAFIALFVGMFIIYNTILISALRRRRELGILRAVGVTPREVFFLFLMEAALLGLLGVIAGLPLGVFLAGMSVDQVAQTISNLYILVVVENLVISPWVLVQGGILGILTAVISAVFPALEASRVSPRETFSVEQLETKFRLSTKRIFAGSLLTLAGALLAGFQKTIFGKPLFGFVSALLAVLGFALLMPALIVLFHRVFRPLAKRSGAIANLANDYLVVALGRTSTASAALMVAVAMVIGLTTMISSFRATVEEWIKQTVAADIYLAPSSNRLSATTMTSLEPQLLKDIESRPGVIGVDPYSTNRISYQGKIVTLGAGNLVLRGRERFSEILKHGDWNTIETKLASGQNYVMVSESFSLRYGKGIGDRISLPTPAGKQDFSVVGVVYDYTSDAGLILMYRPVYSRYWKNNDYYQASVYLRPEIDAEKFRDTLESELAGQYSLLIYSNRSLREEIFRIFDQTFAITYALQFIAFIVAVIGIINALTALVIERSRELAVIRAIGATRSQMFGMILTNSAFMGVISVAVGILAGLVLSAILIFVINRQSFGWTIQVDVPYISFVQLIVLVIISSLLAGLAPAWYSMKRNLNEALHFE